MKQKLRLMAVMVMMLVFSTARSQVFITELADPNNEAGARFVELYNAGATAVDLSTGWQLQRATNDNADYQDPVDLTGTIQPGGFYVICANQTTFTSTFGFAADQAIGTGGPADSNGDDQIRLLSPGSVVEDMFGVLGEDGSGTNHEFEDGRAERKATVTSGTPVYDFAEWNIWNDTGGAGTINDPQDAPADFDPGEWIGAAGGGNQADTPTFTPGTGTYFTSQNITIETTTPGATIYYTTDGNDPDNTSTEYNAAISISTTTTIKAIAYADGFDPSNIASATYTFPTVNQVADIAALRAGATDGTYYQVTGSALLVAKDGFNNRKFIEDATAAILIYDTPGTITSTYEVGDEMQNIIGTLTLSNNMLRFVPALDPGAPVSSGNTINPTTFTLDAVTSDDQAKLVKFEGVTFTEAGSNFANGTNYTLSDGTNTFVFRTDFWNVDYIGTEIPATPQDVVGVIQQYNSTLQITARNAADISEAAVPTPTIVVTPTSLVGFTYEEGSGPSTSQSFTVEGVNLTSDITITPPTNYEISSDDVNFQATAITLTQTGGNVATTTLYTRLEAGLSAGDYNGQQITAAATGATDQTVTLDGNVSVFFDGFIEDFTNSNATSSYGDNSFTGNYGIEWTYVASRDGNGDANNSGINLPALMLRRVADNSAISSEPISGGIGNFSVKLYKGFTGGGDRQVELFINGISQGVSTPFDDFDEHIFEVNNINIGGDFTIQITNTTSKQVIIDDITWTSFDGPANNPPVITNITQTPDTDIMDDQTVSVSADVTDSDGTLASVVLNWGTESGNLVNSIPMSVSSGDTYTTDTDIPAQVGGTTVFYAITATDDLAAETTSAEQSYTVVLLDPVLELTPTSLSGFTYEQGEGPSASQSYTVNGFNFVGSGLVEVTAPASYEISIDNIAWNNGLVLQYADGELIAQPRTIYVRLKAGLSEGTYDEAVAHEDVNIGLVDLPVSGEVTSVTQVADIATLRQGVTDGTVYQLTGEAMLTFAGSSRNQKFIQDGTAGILIDDAAGNITTTYEIGDGITGLTGTLSVYQNMLQFVPQSDPGAPTSTGNTITPVEVTLDALDDTYQAQLVKVNFVDFNTTGNFTQGTNYTLTDPSGSGVMRTQYSNLDYIGTPIPETTQNLTGVILQFSSTMQLIPRSLEDFEEAPITDPTIFADPMVINGLSYPVGGGPSNPQSFMISGVNLTSGISVTTTSAYYEISATGGSNFVPTSPIILNQTNGSVDETPIYVRLKAGLEIGNYNGEQIVANSSGAQNATITVNGAVYDGSGGGGGMETFANLDLEGSSYADGSFLGQDGSTWTYFQSRGDVEITEKALMLGRNRTPQANVYSGTIFGGIGTLNFDYMQAFSTDVNLNVLVNDVIVGNVTSDGEQNVIKNSGTITVNVGGPVVIKFISANNSDGQVVIDNIEWTAYDGGLPVAAAPVFDPPAGTYADPVNVSLSSATPDADIFFSQSSENGPWTAYSTPITVDEATTIWAYATAVDYEDSPVVSASYSFTDVVSVATIAELRAGATDGTVYQLTGEAVLTFQSSTRNQKYIQDATGAILIDDNSGVITTSYNIYDGITGITGTLTIYSNMLQFVPEFDPGAATSTSNSVTPVEVTLDALDNSYQAQLVTVNFADFEDAGNFASGQNYTITDPSGSGVVRTQYSDVNYIGEPIPTTTQNITGVILQFSSTMQLVPRSLADFEEANITDPFIAVSPATLNGFSYEVGSGPSAEQSFVVSALNLTADLSLDAPANYEISLGTGGSFVATDPVVLTPAGGTVAATTIYVRLKAGLDAGTYNGEQILATSAGATDKTVTLNGNVSDPSAGGGFETFANLDYDGSSYQDGTFLGQDGSTWTYVQARGDLQITNESITLGRNRTPQSNVYSGLINGGVGVINFDYMQAFSTDVNLNLLINDVVVGNVTSTGEQNIIKNSGDIVVNVPGQIVIKFINADNNDGQVVIDNISWTAYDGGTPVVLAPTFNPPAGQYFEPIDVTISSATAGATIFYSTESSTGPWTEYTAPVNVSEETTLWAYGELDGYTNSAVSSATYTFSDVVQVATIAELRQGETDGTVYQLTGEAILTFQSSQRNQKFIQDATAAILIDDNSGTITSSYDLYDGITGITGTLTTYAEMLQFVPESDPGAATSSGNTLTPEIVTLSTLDNTYQAQLVTVNLVDFLTDGIFEDGTNYDISDPSGDGIFRTHYDDVDYIGTDIPVELQNVTGVILQFNDDMQLVARSLDDFEEANITDPYLSVNPGTLNGFSYVEGEGPSASQSYQLTGQNLEGSGNITVTAPANYEISSDDNTFEATLDFAFADGVITGQPVTVYVRLKADLPAGTYDAETIAHNGGAADEVFVTLNGEVLGDQLPAITAEIVPQYIQGVNGSNNNRLPYAYWVTLSNLLPDATYRYINQAVVATDDPTTNGAGNVIFVNTSGNFYRSTSPSFSTDGSYGTFTTDGQGSYSGWFITEATGNDRFTPGNEVFMRIRLNDGNEGTVAETYLTTTNSATVINFGTENDPLQGTAIRAISGDLPKSFALLYDNSREGQPIAATSIETTGVDFTSISQYPSFYKDEVSGIDGSWGTIIPNVNDNGIQLIEVRDLIDGSILKTYEAANGVWGTTSTINPVGGLDEILVIDLIEIGLDESGIAAVSVYATPNQFVIEKMNTERLTFEVYNLVGQPMLKTELNEMGRQQISHQLSAGVYIIRISDNKAFAKAVKVIIR